jgi:hypothetical protein
VPYAAVADLWRCGRSTNRSRARSNSNHSGNQIAGTEDVAAATSSLSAFRSFKLTRLSVTANVSVHVTPFRSVRSSLFSERFPREISSSREYAKVNCLFLRANAQKTPRMAPPHCPTRIFREVSRCDLRLFMTCASPANGLDHFRVRYGGN